MHGEDRVPPAKTEPNRPHLIRPRRHLDRVDEPINDRLDIRLPVPEHPRGEGRSEHGAIVDFRQERRLAAVFQRRLGNVEDAMVDSVALQDVRNVAVETLSGVSVSDEADVGEFVAEDVGEELYGVSERSRGWVLCRGSRTITDLAFEPEAGSLT